VPKTPKKKRKKKTRKKESGVGRGRERQEARDKPGARTVFLAVILSSAWLVNSIKHLILYCVDLLFCLLNSTRHFLKADPAQGGNGDGKPCLWWVIEPLTLSRKVR